LGVNYVRLADYNDSVQAQLAKLALDEAEIPCRVGDTDVLQSTLGSVSLYIGEGDVAKARKVLGSIETSAPKPTQRAQLDSSELRVRRAFRTAFAAFLILPGVLHLYSLWILFGVRWATLAAPARRLYVWTIVIDSMVLGPLGWFIARAVFL